MTHLHLRRASSLQTASYTFNLFRLSKLCARARSDVKQISGTVANPVASPQPVVGIHFEVIIGEGLIKPPLLALQIPSVSRISIRGVDQHIRTDTQATMSPDLTKFYAAVVVRAEIHWLASATKTGSMKRRKSEQQQSPRSFDPYTRRC